VSEPKDVRPLFGSAHADLTLVPVESAAQVEEVGRLAEEIWLEHYPAIIGLAQTRYMVDTLQTPAAIAIHVARGARYFLLAHGGQHVGYAAVELQPEASTLFVSKLYLQRELRGLGLGQRALEALSELARDEQLGRLELTVNRNNALALRCYSRFGMTITGTRVIELGQGFAMDDFVLEMRVQA
jgi:ribosomal protein S18 acetylase RimI-like enzyme